MEFNKANLSSLRPIVGDGRKLYIETYGCQMNAGDSEVVLSILQREGLRYTTDPAEADVILINTCSIRDNAEQRIWGRLRELRQYKKKNRGLLVGVIGCMAERLREQLITQEDLVSVVAGPDSYRDLPRLLRKAEGGAKAVNVLLSREETYAEISPVRLDKNGVSAFVSIMRGCNNMCSYCVVPYTRGEEISRPLVDVLVEVAQLADQGVKEVTLLGQNVNAYRGVTPEGDAADFAMLLEYVSEIDGIERIRYTTSHPREFTQRLIDAYTKLPKLVSHVHLPVQAGSDRILTAMKRGYSVLEYKSIIRRLKAARPGIAIATDFIVGFPGETAEDFEKTMRLIDDVGFDASFSFVYSPRPGTPAARLPDETPYSVKLERLQRLQRKIDDNAAEISRNMLGKIERVLVVGPARRGEGMLSARTDNNRIVNFAGDPSLINQMTNVRITEVFPHTLGGELVD